MISTESAQAVDKVKGTCVFDENTRRHPSDRGPRQTTCWLLGWEDWDPDHYLSFT